MRTVFYYRGGEMIITDQALVRLGNGVARYSIRHIGKIGMVRRLRCGRASSGEIAALAALITAGLVVGSVLQKPLFPAASAVLAAILAFRRLRVPKMELWAEYRGSVAVLFSTTDPRVFGQVSRALMRAVESCRLRRDGASAEHPAAGSR
ncbi:DUF6232 family protein [Couchioplanes azureus]|uniref:DUF6232 family protein n=1 Tax=Couchioplanes caeruleus TaxID=56438 RepID=UPI00166FEFAF|nr:DUF6232 family protein [Couchioplanes caeruleus]GGQ85605.1 hypothetical protein GCM10010166_64940 [Couchioplanes caeruleus subsp. azureus]